MNLYGVSFEPIGKQPIVLLKTADDDKFLPIWIGHPEAAAILMKLQGATPPRPMTHDLLTDVIAESGIEFHAEDEDQPGLVTASSLADLDPAEFRKFLETVTPEEFASSLEELEEDGEEDE